MIFCPLFGEVPYLWIPPFFQNIQSTNWQTMRFKPPPSGQDIGWRVEFRPMEVVLCGLAQSIISFWLDDHCSLLKSCVVKPSVCIGHTNV